MKARTSKQPTGSLPTDLSFLDKLNDDGFEAFCTSLLNLHPSIQCLRDGKIVERRIVSATKLLSGTKQHGVDIRAEADDGEVWYFQCKRVSRFGPAEVTKAIKEAEQGFPQADQFVLAITCGLSAKSLELIKQRSKWDCWDASRLTLEAQRLRPREDAINLVQQFFGPDITKALFICSDHPLLKWDKFFERDISNECRYFHHRTPFLPWSGTLKHLEEFAKSGAGRALILTAPGGQGKSRLLLELARRLEEQPQAPRVRFLNLNQEGLSRRQRDFLAREEDELLLVIDDAHRMGSAIATVAEATAKAANVRLLVATRPQALEAVKSQLYDHGYAERIEDPLHLPRWKPEDILKLAEQVLGPSLSHDAPRLAGLADRCPLLVVLGGALIVSGKWPETMSGEEAFRERVFRSFKEDFLSNQPPGNRERIDRLIAVLSFVSPTPKDDTFLETAAEIIGCSPLDVAQDIESLLASGLVVENSEGIRLYPDLFADAVLLDACLDHGGKPSFLHRKALSKLPISEFPSLMRNVAQADWEARARKAATSSLFDPIWKEFAHRFGEAEWSDPASESWGLALECYVQSGATEKRETRSELLNQWASFAVYLPERTLELAELAIEHLKPAEVVSSEAPPVGRPGRTVVAAALPPLLKPIVVWHHKHASRALDILWSLDAEEPKGSLTDSANAIVAIAEAASFETYKPMKAAESVIEWLEQKFRNGESTERVRRQPWIISALLKPFFAREVETSWTSGRKLHIASSILSAKKTRPFRQRALALADKLLAHGDRNLITALIPLIREAVHSVFPRFGNKPTPETQAEWLPDRMDALKVLEHTIRTHENSPPILLQLRPILLNRCRYDPDETVRAECRRLLSRIPDTFEMRVMRVLVSFAYDEAELETASNSEASFEEADERWKSFCREVAHETASRFTTAPELCKFVSNQLQALGTGCSEPAGTDALLDSIAEISPKWCADLLHEMLGYTDRTLDRFLSAVLRLASTAAPDAYRKAVELLPSGGRPEQLCTLISFLSRKELVSSALDPVEYEAIIHATKRPEASVICALASAAEVCARNQPQWAIEFLRHLKPSGERSADGILRALGRIAEKHPSELKPDEVAQCLANLGKYCFPETTSDDRDLSLVAGKFPRQVYEQIRSLHEQAEIDSARLHPRQFAKTLPLGPIEDPEYIDHEIDALWRKAVSAEKSSFSQKYPLALIRSLLQSVPNSVPLRLKKLVDECRSEDELELAAELAAIPGSRFVFDFPDIVRRLLQRGEEFGASRPIRRILWSSASGGGRSFTNGDLNPEYRYILDQGEALANRYRDDPVLAGFYRLISDSERKELESYRREFREDEFE